MNKFFKNWGVIILLLFLIIFIAFLLRIYSLTYQPIFADEAIYIRWAQVMKAESTLRFLPLSDGKQPLFMWFIIPFLKLFSDPLFAGRFVSVLCGSITIIGIFTAAYLLYNSKKASLLAGFIYAISPFSLFFDRMALVDSMLAMFGIWFFIFAILTFKTKRFDLAMVTGFILGGALLTKSTALFFSLLLPSCWILFRHESKKRMIKNVFKFIILSAIIYAIGYAMYNILRLGPNFHLLKLRNLDYVYPLSHILKNPFDPFKGHILGMLNYFLKLGPWTLILLLCFGLFRGLKNNIKPTMLLVAWGLIPIFANAEFGKVVTARYILFCIPFLVIISAQAFLVKGIAQKIILTILIMFSIQALNQDRLLLTDLQAANLPQGERSGYLEEWTSGYGIKEAADYIKSEKIKNSNKQFIIGTEGAFGTLPDGLQIYLNDFADIVIVGLGIGFKEVPESLISSRESGNKTYMVINSTRLLINSPEKEGLYLVAAYPKAFRNIGSTEYNLYGAQESLLLFELK